ncbi:prepronociceptin [Eucyclogobius newberryi]|uniref:prepronociceptin n=1 Tax=Eucyclogobius newberryi TaxID=166745 RepID=UPI003B5AAD00
MKTTVVLLLLCLCDLGQSDCQGDCLSCKNLLPARLSFNTLVCLVECEGDVSPAFSWDFCRKALLMLLEAPRGASRKRSQEEVEALTPDEEEPVDRELLLPMALRQLDRVTQSFGIDESNAAYNPQNALSLEDDLEDDAGQGGAGQVGAGQGEAGQGEAATGARGEAGLSVSKRFGGFVKGRHSYKKIMSPGRSYQKRYGGFVGIRKSARKWNNQKRFSEFLKQYLGMSARATEYNDVTEDLTAQNEI